MNLKAISRLFIFSLLFFFLFGVFSDIRSEDVEEDISWGQHISFQEIPRLYFIDKDDKEISPPDVFFGDISFSTQVETTNAELGEELGDKLRLENLTSYNSAGITIAPKYDTDFGQEARWEHEETEDNYLIYGSKEDGQMHVDPSGISFNKSGDCGDIYRGSPENFSNEIRSVDLIYTTEASSCQVDMYGVNFAQTIPGEQTSGSYGIEMVLTLSLGDIPPVKNLEANVKSNPIFADGISEAIFEIELQEDGVLVDEDNIDILLKDNDGLDMVNNSSSTVDGVAEFHATSDDPGVFTVEFEEDGGLYGTAEATVVFEEPPEEDKLYVEAQNPVLPVGKDVVFEARISEDSTGEPDTSKEGVEVEIIDEGGLNISGKEKIDSDGLAKFTGNSSTVGEYTVKFSTDSCGNDTATVVYYDTDEYTLSVNTEGQGNVSVEPDKETHFAGEEVSLEAQSAEGWYFSEWQGDLSGSAKEEEITMDGNKDITAVFEEEKDKYTLSVDTEGQGNVSVEPDKETYSAGTEVVLVANPAEDWYFSEWQGDLSGSAKEEEITMDGNKDITAVFEEEKDELEEYSLTISIAGDGSGYVDVNPDKESYSAGESVYLEAISNEGSYFKEWSGDLSGSDEMESIYMNENKSVTAKFQEEEEVEYSLAVDTDGDGTVSTNGGGSSMEVMSTPSGLDNLPAGTVVELEAYPAEGWEFSRWEGAVASLARNLDVFMNRNKSVTAVFVEEETTDPDPDPEPPEYNLDVFSSHDVQYVNNDISFTANIFGYNPELEFYEIGSYENEDIVDYLGHVEDAEGEYVTLLRKNSRGWVIERMDAIVSNEKVLFEGVNTDVASIEIRKTNAQGRGYSYWNENINNLFPPTVLESNPEVCGKDTIQNPSDEYYYGETELDDLVCIKVDDSGIAVFGNVENRGYDNEIQHFELYLDEEDNQTDSVTVQYVVDLEDAEVTTIPGLEPEVSIPANEAVHHSLDLLESYNLPKAGLDFSNVDFGDYIDSVNPSNPELNQPFTFSTSGANNLPYTEILSGIRYLNNPALSDSFTLYEPEITFHFADISATPEYQEVDLDNIHPVDINVELDVGNGSLSELLGEKIEIIKIEGSGLDFTFGDSAVFNANGVAEFTAEVEGTPSDGDTVEVTFGLP